MHEGEGKPQLYAMCGRGPRASLRVLRHGLAVTEMAVSELPGKPNAVWTVKVAILGVGLVEGWLRWCWLGWLRWIEICLRLFFFLEGMGGRIGIVDMSSLER